MLKSHGTERVDPDIKESPGRVAHASPAGDGMLLNGILHREQGRQPGGGHLLARWVLEGTDEEAAHLERGYLWGQGSRVSHWQHLWCGAP